MEAELILGVAGRRLQQLLSGRDDGRVGAAHQRGGCGGDPIERLAYGARDLLGPHR